MLEDVPFDVDKPEAFETTARSFKLADVAIEGIGDIGEYNPNGDSVKSLYTKRAGNSPLPTI